MYKSLPLALFVLALAGCGGAAVDDNAASPGGTPASNSSGSSLSASSSSGVAPKEVTPFAQFVTDLGNGKKEYIAQCQGCHGDEGDGQFKLSRASFSNSQALYDVIAKTMPVSFVGDNIASNCSEQCAADVTAFIETWSVDTVVASCDPLAPVTYGVRGLRLLTAQEYENTLEDLGFVSSAANFADKAPVDNKLTKSNFADNAATFVTESYANSYWDNATALAASATSRVANGCGSESDCAKNLLDMTYKMFRRPLSNEERATYTQFISDFGNEEGIKTGLIAALTSPNFLYRSEMGVPLSDAKSAGWSQAQLDENDVTQYAALPGGVTINGVDFSEKSTGTDNEDGTWNIYSDGTLAQTYRFSELSIIELKLKGMDFENRWPTVQIKVGGRTVAEQELSHLDLKTYQFLVTGILGDQTLEIVYAGDEGREPYNVAGNDKNVYVGDVLVSRAEKRASQAERNEAFDLADQSAYVLDPFEYATALAYMFTGSTPDAALMAVAQSGAINNKAVVQQQVNRLMNSEKGQEHIGNFAGVWLNTDEVLGESRPNIASFTDAVKNAMAQEVKELFKHVFYDNTIPFSDFYGGDISMINADLAQFYGANGFNSGSGWQAMSVENRGGILTTGAFLTANAHEDMTSPIHRAVRVRELMLCHHIDPVPPLAAERDNLRELANKKRDEGILTSREFFEIQTNHPSCDGCHKEIINPLFGMEDFDQVGRYRTTMKGLGDTGLNGLTINATGTLIGTESVKDDNALSFTGAKGLGEAIAGLEAIEACLIQNSFRYILNLPINKEAVYKVNGDALEPTLTKEQQEDFACVNNQLQQAYKAENESPKAVFNTIGLLDMVRFRK